MGHPLTEVICKFIEARKHSKITKLDKELEKATDAVFQGKIQEQLAAVIREHEPATWITAAAMGAGRVHFATHVLKFIHPSAKGTNILAQNLLNEETKTGFIGTHNRMNLPIDAACDNAADLSTAALLQLAANGQTLLDYVQAGDTSPLKSLEKQEGQAEEWIQSFQKVLKDNIPKSHPLTRQVYFPLKQGGYHLLAPLFPSALAQAFHEIIQEDRYSENAKQARKAKRENAANPHLVRDFIELGEQHFGGSNAQNVSQLNKRRGGSIPLLSAAPPMWKKQERPPKQDVFAGVFQLQARLQVHQLKNYLEQIASEPSTEYRRSYRQRLVEGLIDSAMVFAVGLQRKSDWAGWTLSVDCQLPEHQKLWLDPQRGLTDATFAQHREAGYWQRQVANDFGVWLNRQLENKKKHRLFGDGEHATWRSDFEQQLRLSDLGTQGTL